MANFDTSGATYNPELRKFEVTDPVHADTFNAVAEQLIKNDVATRKGTGLIGTNVYSDDPEFMVLTANGPKKVARDDMVHIVLPNNAGSHNSIYRGRYLGDHVTDAQWAAIKDGTFDDLFIGDYWTISGVNWRVAAFDYWLHCGDTECTTHHAVIVPDSCLYNAQMHNTASGQWESGGNTTEGAYANSDMRKTNLDQAKSIINSAFGSGHILNHREHLQNAVTNGYASGGTWMDSTVELMSEEQVYGCMQFKPGNSLGSTIPNIYNIDYSQFPLFRLNKALICNRASWWLRDVASAATFCDVASNGLAPAATPRARMACARLSVSADLKSLPFRGGMDGFTEVAKRPEFYGINHERRIWKTRIVRYGILEADLPYREEYHLPSSA
jgi:hypothetical protein